MTAAKKFTSVFLCILIAILMFSTLAGAVTIDGNIETLEWNAAEKQPIFKSTFDSDCEINYALMKVIKNTDKNEIFLAFQVTQKTDQNTHAGIRFNMKPGIFITCALSGINEYDNNQYSVDTAFSDLGDEGFTAEIRIGYKFGISENAMLGLQLIDGFGEPSNFYVWPAVPESTITTTATTEPTTKPPTTKKETTSKPSTKETTFNKATTAKPVTTTQNRNNTSSYENFSKTGNSSTGESGETFQEDTSTTQILAGQAEQSETFMPEDGASADTAHSISKTKQIAATAAAVLLLTIAVLLCVFAGKGKPKLKTGSEEKADTPPVDEDF